MGSAFLKPSMMRIFFVWLLFLNVHLGFCQNGFFTIPDIDAELASVKDMVVDNDTIVIYGTIGKGDPIKWGQYFAKFDTLGNLIKTSLMIADSIELLSSYRGKLIKTMDGGYAMMGAYSAYNQDSTEIKVYTYLLKVKHDLSLDFVKFYQNPGYKISLNQYLINFNSGYMHFNLQQKAGEHGANWFVRAVDADGEELWKKSYYKPDTYNSIYDVAMMDSNEIVLFGNSRDNLPIGAPYTDGFIYPIMMAIDSLGNEKWKWNWDGEITGLRDVGKKFLPTRDGGLLYSGIRPLTPSENELYFHPRLTKLDSNLNIEWRYEMDTVDHQDAHMLSIIETPDSNYIVSGGYRGIIYHGKYRDDGSRIWERKDSTLVSPDYWYQGYVRRSALLSSGSIVSAGYMKNPDKGFVDWNFVMKLSPDGCMDTLACWPLSVDESVQDFDYQVDVYPNPAIDVVRFTLPEGKGMNLHKKIIITDLSGRIVREIRFVGGEAVWDLTGVSQGFYFYRLELDGELVDVGKIVVMGD